ncbi:MAG: GTP-binding protein, partial [Candidatus Latescibacteria bacterium]|nr:GTP-binding protein [Candidatus Latescibacterota bacterium]
MTEKVSIRNLGILAHVDAGKTTLTEHILFLSGATRAVGRVDKGTSLSDGLDVERRRGISVRASTLSIEWSDVRINLIDTPGHMDFAAEVERSLRVLDSAVLVLSAVEGIQSHTEIIWEALAQLDVPVILYVNKIDRVGSDTDAVIANICRAFSPNLVQLNRPVREGRDDAGIEDLFREDNQDLVESIVGSDDAALEDYLDGHTPDILTLSKALKDGVGDRRLFPVMYGSAKNHIGTQKLLDAVRDLCPEAPSRTDLPVSGVIYKVESDPKLGRIAGVRLYAGSLKNRDSVFNKSSGREEKITQIKKPILNQYVDTPVLNAGDIGFLCGLPEAQIGDILGDAGPVPGAYSLSEPVLSAQVTAQDPDQYAALAEALAVLSTEDPHLNFSWLNEEREMHVKIMGKIQMEILTEILDTRFGLQARFGEPTVIYKETLMNAVHGEESYTMPKPCWAIVKFELRTAPRGCGVTFKSSLSVDRVKQKYQNEIATNVRE